MFRVCRTRGRYVGGVSRGEAAEVEVRMTAFLESVEVSPMSLAW